MRALCPGSDLDNGQLARAQQTVSMQMPPTPFPQVTLRGWPVLSHTHALAAMCVQTSRPSNCHMKGDALEFRGGRVPLRSTQLWCCLL